jgi:glycine betaine/proline transport system substrate-binding protein
MKVLIAALPLLFAASTLQAAPACGKVTIADMNWSSASLIANVDRFVLEHGYGCDAQLVPGDTMPTGTSMMEKGEPDIAPELWSNAMKDALDKGVAEKRLRIAGKSLSDGGEEGLWVPQYMVDKDPSIATIAGVIANTKAFEHPEDPDRSALYGCPAGWNCQISVGNLFKALQLDDAGFDLIDPGSGAGLSGALAKAYERKEAWFGYYWAPTAIMGKYKMVKVDFGTGVDLVHYQDCISQDDCENPQVTMIPPSPVQTVTTETFASRVPLAYDYLTRRSFTNAQMNELLKWMEDNQADGNIAMEHFLTEYQNIWTPWVSETVATKVNQALADL